MAYEAGDLVQLIDLDEWYLPQAEIKLYKKYRIQQSMKFPNGFNGNMIGGWWVQDGAVVPVEHAFIRGEKVRIALKVEKEEGWENIWIARMTQHIGEIYTIADTRGAGVYFEESREYGWPLGCLEPV